MKPYRASTDKIRLIARVKGDNAKGILQYLEDYHTAHLMKKTYYEGNGRAVGTIFGGKDLVDGTKHGGIYFHIYMMKQNATGELLPLDEIPHDALELIKSDEELSEQYMTVNYAILAQRREMATLLNQFLAIELEYNPNHFKHTKHMEEVVNKLLSYTVPSTQTLTRWDIAMDFDCNIVHGFELHDSVANRRTGWWSVGGTVNKSTGWLVGKPGNNVQISIYDKNKERKDKGYPVEVKGETWHRAELRLSRSASVAKNIANWDDFNPYNNIRLAEAKTSTLAQVLNSIEVPTNSQNKTQMGRYLNEYTAYTMLYNKSPMFETAFKSRTTRAKYANQYNAIVEGLEAGKQTIDLAGAFESIKKEALEQLRELLPELPLLNDNDIIPQEGEDENAE